MIKGVLLCVNESRKWQCKGMRSIIKTGITTQASYVPTHRTTGCFSTQLESDETPGAVHVIWPFMQGVLTFAYTYTSYM